MASFGLIPYKSSIRVFHAHRAHPVDRVAPTHLRHHAYRTRTMICSVPQRLAVGLCETDRAILNTCFSLHFILVTPSALCRSCWHRPHHELGVEHPKSGTTQATKVQGELHFQLFLNSFSRPVRDGMRSIAVTFAFPVSAHNIILYTIPCQSKYDGLHHHGLSILFTFKRRQTMVLLEQRTEMAACTQNDIRLFGVQMV